MKKIFFLIHLVVFCQTVFALENSEPKFELANTDIGEFVVEKYYTFPVYYYKQPLLLSEIEHASASYSTPEDTFISFISSMKALDKDWFLESWDASSRLKINEEFSDPNFQNQVFAAWKDTFVSAEINLFRRVDTANFIILEAKVGQEGNSFNLIHRFIFEEGKWLVTRKYSDDPIFQYYMTGKSKIRIPAQ